MGMDDRFAYGVDTGWLSQLEQQGYTFEDENGEVCDALAILKKMGANAYRQRVFVDPPSSGFWEKRKNEICMIGFCDTSEAVKQAKRAQDLGFRILIDAHYSDFFADPDFQIMPEAWKYDSLETLKARVYQHTQDILQAMRRADVHVDQFQVGNEINNGMMHPVGRFPEQAEALAVLINSGYAAVKDVSPDTEVVTHLASIERREEIEAFYDTFFANGGMTDVLGFSYYPFWHMRQTNREDYEHPLSWYLNAYYVKYRKPVIIAEIGEKYTEPQKTYDLLRDAVEALRNMPDGAGRGIYYWEPEAPAEVLPDRYPLGAAVMSGERTIRFTKAMRAYSAQGQITGKCRAKPRDFYV